MDSSRKFTFKLPSSSSSKPLGESSNASASSAAASIPFSIKKFSTSSTLQSNPSILNYSSQGAKPLTTNKTKQTIESSKPPIASPVESKPAKENNPPKVSNNKVTKHTAFQSQMTSFLTTASNKTFKKPGVASITPLDSLKDETDDDWAPIELKKTSPCVVPPPAAKKNPTPLIKAENDDLSTTCKAKLKFPSPKKPVGQENKPLASHIYSLFLNFNLFITI